MNSNDKSTGEKSYCPELAQHEHGNRDDILKYDWWVKQGSTSQTMESLVLPTQKSMDYGITDTNFHFNFSIIKPKQMG